MAATVAVFDSMHSGPLHCVEFDFFASRLATASSDRTIRLWRVHPQSSDTENQQQQQLQTSLANLLPPGQVFGGGGGGGCNTPLGGGEGGRLGFGRLDGASVSAGATLLQELHAHDGPVWQVRWAHPSFGNILASCGYDKRIVVWQQQQEQQQQQRGSWYYGMGSFGGYGVSQELGSTQTGSSSSSTTPFVPVYSNEDHAASVNALAFAPPEWGLMLAAGSSDGSISILMHSGEADVKRGTLDTATAAEGLLLPAAAAGETAAGGGWIRQAVFSAHFNGVYAVVWAPACPQLLLQREEEEEERTEDNCEEAIAGTSSCSMSTTTPILASGGADCQVRIWGFDRQSNSWKQLQQLNDSSPHTDWVRDVAFQPASAAALLLPSSLLLASCSEDSSVKLWVYDAPSQNHIPIGDGSSSSRRKPQWRLLQTLLLHAPVWRISWSASGSLLAAACGDEDVVLFRESVSGVWEAIKKLSGPPPIQQLTATEPLQQDDQQQQQQHMFQQQQGMYDHGLQQRGLQQQLQGAGQQPQMGQHVGSLVRVQGLPPLLQEAQQQQPLQASFQQEQHHPQGFDMALQYPPRPQGPLPPSLQQQQQMPPPASLFSHPQRMPQEASTSAKQMQVMPGLSGSTSSGGTGPYPPPSAVVTPPGARVQQQQQKQQQGVPPQQQQQMPLQQSMPPSQQIPPQHMAQTHSWKTPQNAPSATTGPNPPPVMPQQTPTGLSGVISPAVSTSGGNIPPPSPSLLVGATLRQQQAFIQQPFPHQQPSSQLQQPPLQQPPMQQPPLQQGQLQQAQLQQQHPMQQQPQQQQGPSGTMMAGGSGAPPLPPPFLSTSLSSQSVPPQVAGTTQQQQQPRRGVGVNPFQGYQQEGTLPRPPLPQQKGATGGGHLPPAPSTAAGLTPPVSMQQHAFASGGARQQQSLYTPYKSG